MSEALKACPFCGGTDLMVDQFKPLPDGEWNITCETAGCDIIGPTGKSPDDAIAAWNRRAPEPAKE